MLSASIWRTQRRPVLLLLGLLAALTVAVYAPSAHGSHYTGAHLAALNGHYQPTIWFVDYTDASWPVTASAIEWDRTSRVTMGRRPACPHPGDYCIPVSQVSSIPGAYGVSYFVVNASPTHVSRYGGPYVRLSNQTPGGLRRSVTCHELGHWFVLNHRQPSNSCMVAGSVFPNFPDEHDFNQIYDIYGHSH